MRLDNKKVALLEAWTAGLRQKGVDVSPEELSGWLEYVDVEVGHREDLAGLVALHASAVAHSGKPASSALIRTTALKNAADAVGLPAVANRTEALTHVAADAYASTIRGLHSSELARDLGSRAPVIRLDRRTVCAFVVGPMVPPLLDRVLGRLLKLAGTTHATVCIIDVSGADEDDSCFHHSVRGFVESEWAQKLRQLIISGVLDVEKTRAALDGLGVKTPQIQVTRNHWAS